MKATYVIFILLLSLMLLACGQSKQAQFYVLNPIPPKIMPNHRHPQLKIGIDAIHTPAFTEKPQLILYDGMNRVQMEEFHQWATSLDKNIKSVIETDLNTLLPGVFIAYSPWDINFKPDYHLLITISEFKIDLKGNSSLRASYFIFYDEKLVKKYDKFYYLTISEVTIDKLVKSMNTNLNHLAQDIARSLLREK